MVHVYNGTLLSRKKDEILPFATTWMDLENRLSEIRQTEKVKNHMVSLTCGIENFSSGTQTAAQRLPEGRRVGGGQRKRGSHVW